MKHTSYYLFEDIDKFKEAYRSCNEYEKIHFKTRLKLYEWQFENKKDFFIWYMRIIGGN